MHLIFFHSQVRINIDCAFGVLIHCWGCLWKPMPCHISIPKITALVSCLCILHNFCINERMLRAMLLEKEPYLACESVLQVDLNSIILNGGEVIPILDQSSTNFNNEHDRQDQFLDIGHHYDDCPTTRVCSEMAERQAREEEQLPREDMLEQLCVQGFTRRPHPLGSTTKNTMV